MAGLGMASEAQVIVDSKLDRADILVGEQAQLTTTVTADSRQRVRFPEYAVTDTLTQGVEVLNCGKIDTVDIDGRRRMRLSRTYIITSFDSALYALPPMAIEVDGKTYVSRSRLGLKVNTVPVDTVHVDQFAPPFIVTEAPFAWRPDLFLLALVPWLFFIVAIIAGIRLTGHKPIRRKVTIKPPTPPYKKASTLLEQLHPDIDRAVNDEENKAFFVSLTDILRGYINERYGFNAMEKTTQEIVDGLRGMDIAQTVIRSFEDIFSRADFVKFAKHTATPIEREHIYKQAADVLATTRDEVMEQPRATVRYITYSDKRQHTIRLVMWWTAGVTSAAAIGTFVFAASKVIGTFL